MMCPVHGSFRTRVMGCTLSPRPEPDDCETMSTSLASSHADGTFFDSRYACIVIADHTSPYPVTSSIVVGTILSMRT